MVFKPIPDVVGMNIDDARDLIIEKQFKVGKVEEVHDPNVPENDVISQDPSALMRATQGTEINLKVSKGPEMKKVPDVMGKSRAEAKEILEKAGFKVELAEEEFSSKYEAGKVCNQDPAGNSEAAKDSVVTITISKGTEAVQVPDVVNWRESEAKSALQSAGFTVRINREYSDKVDEGYVISQSQNGKLDKGSTVTITVSRGSDNASVPNVVGMSAAEARSTLQNAGFNVSESGGGTKVISQNPISGNKASRGSTVTIYLGD